MRRILLLTVLVCLVASHPALGQDESLPDAKQSLSSLQGVWVLITVTGDAQKTIESDVETLVESSLRKEGIHIYDKEAWVKSGTYATLAIRINVLDVGDRRFFYGVDLSLRQRVMLMDGSYALGTTYSLYRSGSGGPSARSINQEIQESLNLSLKSFANDWKITHEN